MYVDIVDIVVINFFNCREELRIRVICLFLFFVWVLDFYYLGFG